MVGLQRWFLLCRIVVMLGLAGLLASGPGSVAVSQDQPPPKETIFARKILMDSIGRNMDELEALAASAKVDLTEGKDHADIVSVMLLAFPHLFPPATNQWKANVQRDPGTDTFAAPEVWTNYADFYKRAADAAELAFKASRVDDGAAFKDFIGQLRVACDSCHGVYMKKD